MADEEPITRFLQWFEEAKETEPDLPNAMALATTDSNGQPAARMVLLKDVDDQGFVFYTNLESQKGREILHGMKAAMCFHWKSLRRQIRIRGPVTQTTDEEADEYFRSRPRASRIGAWASKQSRPLESRFALEKEVAKFTAKHAVGEVPRPPHWSGFRIDPVYIEFWKDGAFRLHDRIIFSRGSASEPWAKTRFYP